MDEFNFENIRRCFFWPPSADEYGYEYEPISSKNLPTTRSMAHPETNRRAINTPTSFAACVVQLRPESVQEKASVPSESVWQPVKMKVVALVRWLPHACNTPAIHICLHNTKSLGNDLQT
eukprot:scaffold159693_cov23-Prasinocladus_malaysianus.AAC.1